MKLTLLAGLMAVALPAVAQAHVGLRFSVGIGLPGIYCGPSYYAAPPVYFAPPPAVVYAAPAPVYAPPPVVTYSAPVVVDAPVVVYSPPPVIYGPAIGFRYYGGTRFRYRH